MTVGPCCVFRATAPPANDAPPDAVAGEGAASDAVASDADFDEEQDVTSSSANDEELPIAKIISHRDTRGQPDDLNLAYYTVRFAGLEELEEAEDELPEEELLRRAPKLLRSYRRDAADAAGKAAAQAAEATGGASARPHRGRKAARPRQGRGGGGSRKRPWTAEEWAQVAQVGRAQRHLQLGEGGFQELAQRLGRSTNSVYTKWLRDQTPQKKRRASSGGRRPKAGRQTLVGRGRQWDDGVDDAAGDAADDEVGAGYEGERHSERMMFNLMMENAALKAQVKTLRECMGLRGMRGVDGDGGGGGGAAAAAGYMYGRSASRSPPRGRYDPFASQF
jgi:hypothetical protein